MAELTQETRKRKAFTPPMNYTAPERLVRKDEAMFLFGSMPESTFDLYRKDGLIPEPQRLGRIPVWRMSDIQECIARLFGKDETQ